MINSDAALGQQLLHIPVGQAIPQVPADGITSRGNRKPAKTELASDAAVTRPVSGHPRSANATVPSPAVGLLDVFVVHADAISTQGSVGAGLDLAVGVPLLVIGALVATGRLHGRRRAPAPAGGG